MLSNPVARKRYPTSIVTPGLARTPYAFGYPDDLTREFAEQMLAVMGNFYRFHEGDIFLPGPSAWAMDPSHDGPLLTVWGHAFLVRANAFQPIPVGQVAYSGPVQPLVGVGGPLAGQMAFQPLTVRQADGG